MDGDWYSTETATFGDRLTAAREATGLAQKELARRLGVKLRTVDDWENDLSEPRANKLAMMAGLLGVSVGWLLTGEGDGLEPPQDSSDHESGGEAGAILLELRELRTQMLLGAERLARLEKRLRQMGTAE
ncbi:helix-turn-helix domain-containing protein [Poseidonocella sedimentorum]|uniref:Transcriptional regulator, contains XRE-family HTH domain n=1 Tax=Poseidonocella sedimentorum TaxID=871652 RepID=A0A1I6EMZ5_9RHOB|nr:helix-turn-helix transcriptional regulator [Poseidonocella sedimentorum]SFR19055.1 Transcriptional regulator, contains XRE-family HTH domain [Poseidonocella sedimentorum]